MNHTLQSVADKVEHRRAVAAVVVASGSHLGRPVTDEQRAQANVIEQRANAAGRRIRRLQRLHEREEGDVASLELSERFSLDELEAKLGMITTTEEDPGAKDDGTGRRIPPPDFGERKR